MELGPPVARLAYVLHVYNELPNSIDVAALFNVTVRSTGKSGERNVAVLSFIIVNSPV